MNGQTKILLLEDDPNLGLIVEESLTKAGFSVQLVRDGQAGLDALGASTFHICLVDVMMPIMDGFSFAGKARRQLPEIPLIFLTARSMIKDKTEGYKIGCDDYLTKPFSMEELLLRIEAVLRRSGNSTTERQLQETENLGEYLYHPREQILQFRDEKQKLTGKEASLLELLFQHRNKTLERSVALLSIWGDDSYHCGRSMDVFVSRLRKYLDSDPNVEIRTVHGEGLKLLLPED